MIVAGIGSRKGVAAKEVLAAIDAALAAHGLSRGELDRAGHGGAEAPTSRHHATPAPAIGLAAASSSAMQRCAAAASEP